ncbi:hypothetical protein [Halorubrum trapanicum]|uniref:hypothetical protein n=1 Tax=Halorubrum trapanicum TaxID=29284 RepID=UPI000BBA6A91|nr:hypothetical protein [Halorubrum trapanicum]
MRVTPQTVRDEHAWVRDRADVVVPILNDTRDRLGRLFETDVDSVAPDAYRREVDAVFADGEVAVNVAACVALLRDLDVAGDYPGFVVDEVLGRELAATIAGGRPLSLLAQATFHVADLYVDRDATAEADRDAAADADRAGAGTAGADDLDAALAAGFQTRLPGWDWREGESPFAVDAVDRGETE